jgi:hypothetical protein
LFHFASDISAIILLLHIMHHSHSFGIYNNLERESSTEKPDNKQERHLSDRTKALVGEEDCDSKLLSLFLPASLRRHRFEKFMSLVPYAKVQPANTMEFPCSLEVYPQSEAAAISTPTQRGRAVMDTAASFIQINTVAIRFVGKHQCPRDVRMWFCLIIFCPVFWKKSDGITLAAKRAAVAWHFFSCKFLFQ